MQDVLFYERRLPHRLPPSEVIFLTFRLAGSLPREAIARLQAEADLLARDQGLGAAQLYLVQKRHFSRCDAALARAEYGPTWLAQPDVAALVAQSLHYFDGTGYKLLSYCLMPNHVHLLVVPLEAPPLVRTLQRLKGYTALQANRLLARTGAFWQDESYDHVVRPGELERIVAYIQENPVKAGLVAEWQHWPHTYVARTL